MNHFYSVMLNYSDHTQAVAGPVGRGDDRGLRGSLVESVPPAAAASHAATQVSQSTDNKAALLLDMHIEMLTSY